MPTPTIDFLSDLRRRGLLQQCTDEPALAEHLRTADPARGGRRGYVGFDPTADSLTIGNLVGIIQLARLQRAGHTPVVIMGGGTGFIGDPSGKSAERMLMTPETIAANVQSIRGIFERVIDFSPSATNRGQMLDNYDWLGRLSYIHVLRDVGKHFSVNMMIQKESVKERLHNRDQGISYTEFSYMILQAYDYLHLFEKHGVTLQMGGSDQFGNIVCGMDLIRRGRAEGDSHQPFGLTWPLVTKADGGKFGKTESGAVWLSAHRTSPYAFYQFWLNAADADVIRFLKVFTFLTVEEIDALEAAHAADPGKREAQRALARHMTELLHGPTEREHAEAAARALFTGDIAHLPLATLEEALASAPSSEHPRSQLEGTGVALIDVLAQTTLAKSRSEARTLLSQNSISVNGHKAAADARLTTATLLHGKIIALRRGNKAWHITRWV
ncbi:MAG: tyrosine--tRNA ligase [Phycisphaeraceae bacterium]|nr:tyrosine--tRNA ligase [Phycisphaeraceae bacterium]